MLERRNPTAAAFESVSDRRACWRFRGTPAARSTDSSTLLAPIKCQHGRALAKDETRERSDDAGFWMLARMQPPAPQKTSFRDARVLAAAGAHDPFRAASRNLWLPR